MAFYQPLQRADDSRWRYTCTNGGGTFPVGYCAGFPNFDGVTWIGEQMIAAALAKAEPHREKYHCDGHATAEEAVACYRRYQLDLESRFDCQHSDKQERCLECQAWTQGFALIGQSHVIPLCDEHRNPEIAAKHYNNL